MMEDIYIAAHLRRCLRHSVIGHVLQYTPSPSVLDTLHLHHAVKSPPLRHPFPSHRAFIEAKNEPVKTKNLFPMKVITHSITHTEKFAGGRSRLDLLLPSFLPSREEKKIQDQKNHPLGCRSQKHTPPKHLGRDEKKIQDRKNHPLGCRGVLHTPHTDRVRIETKIQDRIFCPLRGHLVGRMLLRPTTCRQEALFPINSREERIETKIQEQKNRPLGSRGVLHTPHTDRVRTEMKMQERRKQSIDSGAEWHNPYTDRVRTETKMQERIFCPLWGHAVGRMRYDPTTCRQETLFPINSREERIETKIQNRKNHPLGSRGILHTPHTGRVRIETKKQERRKQSIDSGAEWHTPFMRQGKRDAVWRDTFLEQRARVAIWRDRRLEEKSSHARMQLKISGENSKPHKSSLVALSEQLRDIFAA